MFKKLSSIFVLVCLLMNMFVGINAYATENGNQVSGHVIISVEKFTLGQGYCEEPVIVPFYEGDNGATVLTRLLGEGNYQNSGSLETGFYLTHVKDEDISDRSISKYILDKIEEKGVEIGARQDELFLAMSDYTEESGWMSIVNNAFLNVGFSEYIPQDGDVIRTQFSVYGWGSDIGGGWEENYIIPANKDALTVKVAEINSDLNKSEILSDKAVQTAYNNAYVVLTNMESSQESLDSALLELVSALGENEGEDIFDLEETYKDTVDISTWAYEAVEKATQKGFIQGSDSKFNPKNNVTRAEFTKIMASVLELNIETDKVITFTDVEDSDWFYSYVNAAFEAGIIKGADNKFNPNENITREEMAVIIVRALEIESAIENAIIKDLDKVSDWAKGDVEVAVSLELMMGDGNQFNPKEIATREMATVVAMRGFEYRNNNKEENKDTDKKKELM